MVAVVVFEFSGMRCQPLRRALCLIHKNQLFVLSISLAFRSCFVGNSMLFVAA